MFRPDRATLLLVSLAACAGSERVEVRPPSASALPELGAAAPPSSSTGDQPLPALDLPAAAPVLRGDASDHRAILEDVATQAAYPADDLEAVADKVRPESVRAAVQALYERRGGAWVWSDQLQLTPAAWRLIHLVEKVEDHGLSRRSIRLSLTQRLVAVLEWNRSLLDGAQPERTQLRSLFQMRRLVLSELDAQLTASALSLARQMGLTTTSGAALANVLPTGAELERWVHQLVPWHPQYKRLLSAMRRYRRYARRGFPRVRLGSTETAPKVGGRHPVIGTLRRRLAAEGFQGGPVRPADANRFDRLLLDDLKAFQRSRGLSTNGELDQATLRALNVSARALVRELRDGLSAWRESRTRDSVTFLQVNLPEYSVELYRGGQRVARHRAVIGYPFATGGGRTKRFHSEVDRVVLNPGWTPSDNILNDELVPKEKRTPGYLRRKGFRWFTRPDGRKGVYQLPGQMNSLGEAALRFPNKNNIYLHGSPDQEQFEFAVRAMSHGCVRVEGIRSLARELLVVDGRMSTDEVGAAFESGKTREVHLQTAIPIHFEYVRTVVDDDGTVRFLPNIYRM